MTSLGPPARTRGTVRSALLAVCLGALALGLGSCGGNLTPSLMANTAPPLIRVRLGAPRPRARLALPAHPWTIRSTSGDSYVLRAASEVQTELAASSTGIVIRGRSTGAAALRIEPDDFFTLDGRVYDGHLLVTQVDETLVFINELDLETYVAGVIGNEVGPGAEPATYRAQAVAARTYGWMRRQEREAEQAAFHVYDSAASQVYTGRSVPAQYGIRYDDMLRRTTETRGAILTYEGRPFRAYYASTCGGHTTAAAVSGLDPGHAAEPLRGVACAHCTSSKYYRWTAHVTDAEVVAGFKARGRPVSLPIHAIDVTRARGGWVSEGAVRYGASGQTRTIPGHELRSALGLRSHRIERITRESGGWVIQGRGWGHGVGMCQVGAIEMGKKGASESEILRYYYPGIAFAKVY